LEVSEPGDRSEQEAVAAADRLFPASGSGKLHRTDSRELTETAPAHFGLAIPRKETSTAAGNNGLANLPWGQANPGRPLPDSTRQEMEAAFGADFSAVRIHNDSNASQAARSLNANAFTYGNQVFFDQGQYDPESQAGKNLIAHELAHTLQQQNTSRTVARDGEGRTTLQCVNENLSSAGVASWLLAIIGTTCGLIFGIAGSPTGPGAAGAAAFGAATCIAGVIGFSVGAVLGIISGCWSDPNFQSRGAHPR